MANRSYLYSYSHQGILVDNKDTKISDLSEWMFDIPLSYFILISGNTTLCPSLLSHQINTNANLSNHSEYYALSGDFDLGFRRLMKFLKVIEYLFNDKGLSISKEIERTHNFLSTYQNTYIQLETIELDIMDCQSESELKSQALSYSAFVEKLGKLIDLLPDDLNEAIKMLSSTDVGLLGDELIILENISITENFDRSDKNFMLGITEWSNILHHTLNTN